MMREMKMKICCCLLLAVAVLLTGCAGTESFSPSARAGDTIALAVGWKHEFTKDKITVTITPAAGTPIVFNPNDPAIRATVNWYPDPVSWLTVGTQNGAASTGESNKFVTGSSYGGWINDAYTNYDPDWWQTVVFIDLPASLTTGAAQVQMSSNGPSGETYGPVAVQILGSGGTPTKFKNDGLINGLGSGQLGLLGRASHYVVSFTGDTVPYGIQLVLSHDAGVGIPYVVNTRGDVKSINWTDNGSQSKVIITPSWTAGFKNMQDFKFYVSGGVAGLQLVPNSVQAFDTNGVAMTGVTASIQSIQ